MAYIRLQFDKVWWPVWTCSFGPFACLHPGLVWHADCLEELLGLTLVASWVATKHLKCIPFDAFDLVHMEVPHGYSDFRQREACVQCVAGMLISGLCRDFIENDTWASQVSACLNIVDCQSYHIWWFTFFLNKLIISEKRSWLTNHDLMGGFNDFLSNIVPWSGCWFPSGKYFWKIATPPACHFLVVLIIIPLRHTTAELWPKGLLAVGWWL